MKSTFQENEKQHFILNSDLFFAVKLNFLFYAFRQLRTLLMVDKMDNALDRDVFFFSDVTAITGEVL
ncbi:phosphoenolpyruvate synthase regulatory protein, partial [Enterobacter hormaechei]